MPSTYIPRRDADLDNWLANFQAQIAAAPASYGLKSSDATVITAAYASWHAAFVAATAPTTRTKSTVLTKDEQRRAALTLVRGYAKTIRASSSISDALKIGLGLHAGGGVGAGTRVPAPDTYPTLAITGMDQGVHELRAADERTSTRRAKPAGVAGLLLFRAVADGPVSDPEAGTFLAFVTRAECTSHFTRADHGKTATYFARWTNHKGQVGPWSPAASMPIAA